LAVLLKAASELKGREKTIRSLLVAGKLFHTFTILFAKKFILTLLV